MSAPSMPPHFPFVDGGYIQVLTLLGHTDFRICCHPFRHHPEEPGGCDMCRRILTDTGTVEFRPSAPVDLYSFKADPPPRTTSATTGNHTLPPTAPMPAFDPGSMWRYQERWHRACLIYPDRTRGGHECAT